MAIKGKKKSQSRGSQARRRPAAMPRPVGAARKPPWYRTTTGQTIIGITLVVALLLVIWAVTSSRSRARELEATQDALEQYTGQVEALGQDISQAVTAMTSAGTLAPADLGEEAPDWVKGLDDAQTAVAQLFPPEEADAANQIFSQAVLIYRSAARTFELAGDAEGDLAADLSTQGVTQTATATSLWTIATDLLDDAREEAELDASGIDVPSGDGAAAQPGAADLQIPAGEDDADAGGDTGGGDDAGGDGKGKGGGNGG